MASKPQTMNRMHFKIITGICVIFLLQACTKIPLLTKAEFMDKKWMGGYWVKEKECAIKFTQTTAGIEASVYVYDEPTNSFKLSLESKIGSTKVQTAGNNIPLLTIKVDENSYFNFKYEFQGNDMAVITEIDDNYVVKRTGNELTSSNAFFSFVKADISNTKIFGEESIYRRKSTISVNNSTSKQEERVEPKTELKSGPQTCNGPSYKIYEYKLREWLRDFQAWDDWSDYINASSKSSSMKFFSSGVAFKLQTDDNTLFSLNFTNISLKSKNVNEIYEYSGFVKQDGDLLGSVTILTDHTYDELMHGLCDAEIGVTIDNTNFSNFFDNLFKGSKRVSYLMSIKSIQN